MGPDLTPIHPRSQGLFPTPPGNEDDSCFYEKNKNKNKKIKKAVINHPTRQGMQHQQAIRDKKTNMIKQ